ncbi:MAG TPA: cytochrome c3 family protein [Terriglobia bacterium]|nr:cytochrome c3 family protein [Terriglobia bacterium]
MSSRIMTVVLLVGLFFSLLALVPGIRGLRLPGNQQGYEPLQPIAFSHRLHAGEMQISCLYCHSGAEKSRHAGIPAASVCMNCHKYVTAPLGAIRAEDESAKKEKRQRHHIISPELQKLYNALALDEKMQADSAKQPTLIAWMKVHNLPDFAYFDHRGHVDAGVTCQQCHGPVETMEKMRQVEDLTMGWCVNCHREANRVGVAGKTVQASTDCATCHY